LNAFGWDSLLLGWFAVDSLFVGIEMHPFGIAWDDLPFEINGYQLWDEL